MKSRRKKNVIILLLPFLLLFFININKANSQPNKIIIKGGVISFYVHSYSQFESGLTRNGWTTINFDLNDTDISKSGWKLQLRADNTVIQWDDGAPGVGISLNSFVIQVQSVSSSNGDIITTNSPLTVTNSLQDLCSGNLDVDAIEIVLNYQLGVAPSPNLLNKPPGYYYMTLEFFLETDI